jgi:hypothetical protein
VIPTILLHQLFRSAKLAKRPIRILQSKRRRDRHNPRGNDYALLALLNFSNGFDSAEVTEYASRLLVHLEEGEAELDVCQSGHGFCGRSFASDGFVGGGVEDLCVEDGGAAWEPVWSDALVGSLGVKKWL